jgi:hypothetical protein
MPDRSPTKSPSIRPVPPEKGRTDRNSERRAKALRDNLLKRKSQARARTEPNYAKEGDPEE